MIKRFKAWLASFHKWSDKGSTKINGEEVRICKCCGVVEQYYEWEGASWWGVLYSGDPTKPCFEPIKSHITPPY